MNAEEAKYAVWSWYYENTDDTATYSEFCDAVYGPIEENK